MFKPVSWFNMLDVLLGEPIFNPKITDLDPEPDPEPESLIGYNRTLLWQHSAYKQQLT
jgi:hypothetical protein